jgi:hypothetical protein
MVSRTLLPRVGLGLWLVAMLADGTVWAQNHYYGPGVIVIHRYRPGGWLYYGPNTYTYVQTNPYVYGPLVSTSPRPSYRRPIQMPIPTDVGTGAAAPNPYQEYYSPHIPRYHRQQDQAGQTETPLEPALQNNPTPETAIRELTPAASEPEPVVPGGVAESPPAPPEQVKPAGEDQLQPSPPTPSERTRKPARRKPIRYR